jgi:ribosomal-protein-alanine N-acetyltransferase
MLPINFEPFPNLVTEKLSLRQLTPEDVNELFKLRSDEKVNRFLTRNPSRTIEDASAFINKINRGIRNNESMHWAITLKSDNRMIGTICLWNIQPENYRAEIGYELNPDFWGKGIMKEAIAKVIHYGFDIMKLHSLEADLDPGNFQSIMLLEKNGFIKEGHFRESTYFNGKFLDRAVYSLLNK